MIWNDQIIATFEVVDPMGMYAYRDSPIGAYVEFAHRVIERAVPGLSVEEIELLLLEEANDYYNVKLTKSTEAWQNIALEIWKLMEIRGKSHARRTKIEEAVTGVRIPTERIVRRRRTKTGIQFTWERSVKPGSRLRNT